MSKVNIINNVTNKILARTLPSNVQAEQMLIGAILINPELLNQVTEFLRSQHFFEALHQKIYNAIEIITEKGLTATPITLKSMLDRDPLFQQAGGSEYLGKLATLAMMVINAKDYGQIIYELALKRHLIQIGENMVNTAYDSSLEHSANQQIEQAETKLYNLATEGANERNFVKINESVSDSLASINRAMKSSDHVIGISTGLIDLDTKLSGFHNSDLVIIAGRPSMGKTAFAINFAINACKSLQQKSKDPDIQQSVGVFSLEMSSEQLVHRLLSIQTNIDSSSLRSGKVNEEHYNSLRKAAAELSELPFFIDDTPALSISAIRTRARKLKRKHNLGILFIDYLQLIKGTSQSDNRVLEISEITQGLKAIAKELNIPVIALSQLSRAVEQRDDKRPMLSDLRESGSIEQDADVVMFLYREEYYLSRKEPSPGDAKHAEWQSKLEQVHNITDIIVAKHRNGPTGSVQVYYETRYSKISNLQKLYR
jgi:replicative DNA helicase